MYVLIVQEGIGFVNTIPSILVRLILSYLKNIKTINAACTKKPSIIVTILSLSFWIAALPNSNIRPTQVSKTLSTLGTLSLKPINRARSVGIKTEFKTIMATHPKASAETGANFFWMLTRNFSKLKSCIFWILFIKNVTTNFGHFWFSPLWVDVVCMIINCLLNCAQSKIF